MAVRDFDAERVEQWQTTGLNKFTIGGEEFILRPVVDPESIVKWEQVDEDTPSSTAMDMLDEVMRGFIIPSQGEKYMAARHRKLEDLLGDEVSEQALIEASRQIIDLQALISVIPWIIEQVTGRPFESPSDSTTSSEANGTRSTVPSPSEELTSPASISAAS